MQYFIFWYRIKDSNEKEIDHNETEIETFDINYEEKDLLKYLDSK